MSPYEYFKNIEKPCTSIFAEMQNRGIRVDLSYLQQLKSVLEQQKAPIEAEIKNELGNINLNSTKQLLKALNAKGIYPKLKNKASTDKRAIQAYAQVPVVQNLLEYGQVETLLSSFVIPYLERSCEIVHPFFNQCGTRTGRLSCSNPNLLQIPNHTDNGKLVRKMFTARPGMLLGDCDFGQIEPRVLAHLSKDENLCEMFNSGLDFHQFIADSLGISRDRAKVLNLSVGYRATFKSVSQQLKCDEKSAQNEINKWWTLFPTLRRWEERTIHDAKKSGFCTTLLGRRIKVDNLTHANFYTRQHAERQLINNIAQGSAAEIMKLAMINVKSNIHKLSMGFGMLIQVYDELVCESSEMENELPIIKRLMESCLVMDVPLVVAAKRGPNWSEVN